LEIHTLEHARYTLRVAGLAADRLLDCWFYWLLHDHEYEPAAPQELLLKFDLTVRPRDRARKKETQINRSDPFLILNHQNEILQII